MAQAREKERPLEEENEMLAGDHPRDRHSLRFLFFLLLILSLNKGKKERERELL